MKSLSLCCILAGTAMGFEQVQTIMWDVGVFAQVMLIGAILHRGLARRYPFFLSYIAFQAISSVILMQFKFESLDYTKGWRLYEAAMIVLRAGVACELFERYLAHFHGIGRFRFWMAGIVAGMSGLACWALFGPLTPETFYLHTDVMVIARFETFAIAASLALMWLLLTKFVGWRPALAPNIEAHWKLIAVYFSLGTISVASAIIGGPRWLRFTENILVLAGGIACVAVWLRLFSKAGEMAPIREPRYTDQEAIEVIRRDREIHAFITGLPDEIARHQARR